MRARARELRRRLVAAGRVLRSAAPPSLPAPAIPPVRPLAFEQSWPWVVISLILIQHPGWTTDQVCELLIAFTPYATFQAISNKDTSDRG